MSVSTANYCSAFSTTAWSPNNFIALGRATTNPRVQVYKAYTDPFEDTGGLTSSINTNCYGVAWSPTTSVLASTHTTAVSGTSIKLYDITTDPYTPFDPTDLDAGSLRGCIFSPNGDWFAYARTTAPYVGVYETSGWTLLSDPATTPTGSARNVAFSPDSSLLAVAHATSPYVTIYDTSTIPFTKIADPASLPNATCYAVAFNHAGTLLAVGKYAGGSPPHVYVYNTSDWSLETSFAVTVGGYTANSVTSLAFHPTRSDLAIGCNTGAGYDLNIFNTDTWTGRAALIPGMTSNGIYDVSYTADGSLFATVGNYGGGSITSMQVWDSSTYPYTLRSISTGLSAVIYYSCRFNKTLR